MRKDSEPSPLSYNRFQATRVYKSFGRPPINLGRPRLVRTCTLLCPVPSTFSRPNSRVPGRRNFPPSRQASGRRNKGSVGRETTSSERDIRAVLSPRHQRIMIKKEEKRRANFGHDGYDSWLVSGGARGGVENREPVQDTRAGFYDLLRDKLDSLTVTLVHYLSAQRR